MPIRGMILGTSDSVNQSSTKGWAAGHMQTGIAESSDFEIKLWDYPQPFEYGKKLFVGTEFITVSGGALRLELELDGETESVILKGATRDYVIIPPGVTKKVIVHEAPAWGVTVRWPSGNGVNRTL